jgi:hypothetical protein
MFKKIEFIYFTLKKKINTNVKKTIINKKKTVLSIVSTQFDLFSFEAMLHIFQKLITIIDHLISLCSPFYVIIGQSFRRTLLLFNIVWLTVIHIGSLMMMLWMHISCCWIDQIKSTRRYLMMW